MGMKPNLSLAMPSSRGDRAALSGDRCRWEAPSRAGGTSHSSSACARAAGGVLFGGRGLELSRLLERLLEPLTVLGAHRQERRPHVGVFDHALHDQYFLGA